jgi:hypothetical protein
MLHLLCIAPLETVSGDLVVWLLTEGRAPGEWENAALVAVCRVKTATELLLRHPELWLANDGLPVRVQLQVMLAVASDGARRALLIAFPAIAQFCARAGGAADTEAIEVIGPLLKKCRVDAALFSRIVESGAVRAFADLIGSALAERTIARVFAFAEVLTDAGWVDDFLTFIRAARTRPGAGTARGCSGGLPRCRESPSRGPVAVRDARITDFLAQNRGSLCLNRVNTQAHANALFESSESREATIQLL